MLNLVIRDTEDLHPLISQQEIATTMEVEAAQDLHEVHHLQVDQQEAAVVLPEAKEVVQPLNQEEEDKLKLIII
jgi:hypothetical protein